MDQPDHVTSVIAITVCKFIQKLITKVDFSYQRDLLGSIFHVCLVPIIHFTYYFSINLTNCNCNYRCHVVRLAHGLKKRNCVYVRLPFVLQSRRWSLYCKLWRSAHNQFHGGKILLPSPQRGRQKLTGYLGLQTTKPQWSREFSWKKFSTVDSFPIL